MIGIKLIYGNRFQDENRQRQAAGGAFPGTPER
jgi:hypothetical protein